MALVLRLNSTTPRRVDARLPWRSFYHTAAVVVLATTTSCGSPPPKASIDPAKCGNGELDSPEACDPAIESGPGACPVSCELGNACGTYELRGEADACTARCELTQGVCGPVDGCCPVGCTRTEDSDCPIDCDAPANAELVVCMSEEEERTFCATLPRGEVTCSNGESVRFDPDDCEGFSQEFPESCAITTAELRACAEDPCSLVEGRAACAPLLECILVEEDPQPRVPGEEPRPLDPDG